jgi:hypothetical protein
MMPGAGTTGSFSGTSFPRRETVVSLVVFLGRVLRGVPKE